MLLRGSVLAREFAFCAARWGEESFKVDPIVNYSYCDSSGIWHITLEVDGPVWRPGGRCRTLDWGCFGREWSFFFTLKRKPRQTLWANNEKVLFLLSSP